MLRCGRIRYTIHHFRLSSSQKASTYQFINLINLVLVSAAVAFEDTVLSEVFFERILAPPVLHAITHGGQDFSRRTPTPERSNLFGSSARGGGFIT
jgi:hypothetical protein